MIIEIEYESKYSLGTTQNGETILYSMGSLKEKENKEIKEEILVEENSKDSYFKNLKVIEKIYPNFKYNDITEDTVLGILCRLVGDIRRLDEIKDIDDHPIIKIKEHIRYELKKEYFQNELITLHTIPKESQGGAGGVIKNETNLINNNDFSELLLSVFNYKTESEIKDLILKFKNKDKFLLEGRYKNKINLNNIIKELRLSESLLNSNEEFNEDLNKLYNLKVRNIHGLLLYDMINFIKENNLYENDVSKTLTKNGNIPGISTKSGTLTVKDFLGFHVGEKKENWLLPYSINIKYQHLKKDNNNKSTLNSNANIGVTKEGGKLIIILDVDKEIGKEINRLIENAKVNTFYLGKKGIAYVREIKGI